MLNRFLIRSNESTWPQTRSYLFIFLFFCFNAQLFMACSGYSFKKNENPLAKYGIQSVSVPMFLNRTPLPGPSGVFTKEFVLTLSKLKGLKIYYGEHQKSDAILIGIIDSAKNFNNTLSTANYIFSENDTSIDELIGDRGRFNIPQVSSIKLQLNLVLIKDPLILDKKLAYSEMRPYLLKNKSKIIYNETFDLSRDFSRTILTKHSDEDVSQVNAMQNQKHINESLAAMAKDVANSFEKLVLNAF